MISEKVSAELENSEERVVGYLSVLAFDFEHVKLGHYISNKANKPFSYRIKPETIEYMPIILPRVGY